MPFEKENFAPSECNAGTSGLVEAGDNVAGNFKGQPRVYLYNTSVDNIAAVEAANYFNDVANALAYELNTGDIIITVATDGVTINAIDNVVGVRPSIVVTLSAGATLA